MLPPPIKVAILASYRQDLFTPPGTLQVEFFWFDNLLHFLAAKADVFVDFDFDGSSERMHQLKTLTPATVVVNAVSLTCSELPTGFVRINGWPGFTNPDVVEFASAAPELPQTLLHLAEACKKTCLRVPDTVGMVRPRIIAMIINEAFLAAEQQVSSPAEIDTAMKLGTNYPLGPFEWAQLIGRESLLQLLQRLAEEDPAYQPAPLLNNESFFYELSANH